jgi:hypothetical protein
MNAISLKKILFILNLFIFAPLFAADSVWVRATGSGWNSPEDRACRDAERDADWRLEDACRWEANGNFYSVHFKTFSRCDCYESGNDYYRCRTDGQALCEIFD